MRRIPSYATHVASASMPNLRSLWRPGLAPLWTRLSPRRTDRRWLSVCGCLSVCTHMHGCKGQRWDPFHQHTPMSPSPSLAPPSLQLTHLPCPHTSLPSTHLPPTHTPPLPHTHFHPYPFPPTHHPFPIFPVTPCTSPTTSARFFTHTPPTSPPTDPHRYQHAPGPCRPGLQAPSAAPQ